MSEVPHCNACGLLAKRPTDIPGRASPSPMLYAEVEQAERDSGNITDMRAVKIGFLAQRPCYLVCMVGAVDLGRERAEYQEPRDVPAETRINRQILEDERPECQSEFFRYVPGLSPEKHVEFRETGRLMERLEELRRANDLKIAELDQRSQESMRQIMEGHKEIAEATHRDYTRSDKIAGRYQAGFVVLAAIALILALAPLAYPDGIAWVVDNAPGAINPKTEQPAAATLEPSPVPPTPSPESTPDTASPQP